MLEELDYEDEIPAGDNDGECDRRVEKPNIESKDEKESDSDTGEILDDEEPNDLEEGEIKDSEVSTKKNSDSVCRFFQRGACMFGSQCQFLHVSDRVYKLLDTKPVNKNNWNGFPPQPFPPPQFFHNPAPPPIPDIQNSWERGIQNAKKIMQQGIKRSRDESDAYEEETDWDRGLAQAKALISNSSSKRKDNDKTEKLNPEKSLKFKREREPSPQKRFYGTNVQKPQYMQESDIKKENFDNGRKPKYDKERSNYHMDWVDPWRRSKSPKGRKRSRSVSRSLSLSPPQRNRIRKRSGSSCSCSSSSSNFKRTIYGSPILNQSKRSRSRSFSISPPTLQEKSNTHSHKQTHRRHSYKKSFSRSPSYSRSRSSSCSSGGFLKSRDNQKFSVEKGLVRKKPIIINNNGKKPLLPERAYKEKSVHSDDDDSSSDMTVSSLSGSSLSSISDTSSLHNESVVRRDKRGSPPPRNGFGNNQRKTDYSNTNQSYQRYPYKPRKPVTHVERRRVSPSRNGYAPQNRRSSFEGRVHELPSSSISKAKSHRAISVEKTSQLNQSVEKPAAKPLNPVKNPPVKRVKRQVSSAELELLKYHSPAPTEASKPLRKPIEIKPVPAPPPPTPVVVDCPKVPEPPTKHKITLNLQPKMQKQFKPAENVLQVCNTEKEGSSKRDHLLQQLKAIEDAIARKKHVV